MIYKGSAVITNISNSSGGKDQETRLSFRQKLNNPGNSASEIPGFIYVSKLLHLRGFSLGIVHAQVVQFLFSLVAKLADLFFYAPCKFAWQNLQFAAGFHLPLAGAINKPTATPATKPENAAINTRIIKLF